MLVEQTVDFNFWAAALFSRISPPDFSSSFLCEKKSPDYPSLKTSGKALHNLCNKHSRDISAKDLPGQQLFLEFKMWCFRKAWSMFCKDSRSRYGHRESLRGTTTLKTVIAQTRHFEVYLVKSSQFSETCRCPYCHSSQNDYIHQFLCWAVSSEYVQNSLTYIILADSFLNI